MNGGGNPKMLPFYFLQKERIFKKMKLKTPLVTQIEVTQNCNNLCMHCYNYWRYDGINKFNCDEPNNLENIVKRVIDADVFHIVFTGGEPLLKYDFLLSAVQLAASKNVSSSLNSNLAFMTSEKMKQLKEAGLGGILTSVYSADEKINNIEMNNSYALQNTLQGMATALNEGVSVSVNMVVTKNNFDQVYKTGAYLRNIGIHSFNASRFSPAVSEQAQWVLGKSEIKEMLDQLQKLNDEGFRVGTLNPVPHCFASGKYVELTQRRGCSAGTTSVGIGVDGAVRACQHTNNSYGSILTESLENIWQRIPVWKERYLPTECEGCASTNQCGGGCRHAANILKGSYKDKDPLFSGKNKCQSIKKEKEPVFLADSSLSLYSGLRRRKESFGGIIFRDLQNFALVDNFIYELLPSLVGKKFMPKEVANTIRIPLDTVNKYFSYLYGRGMIYKYDGGEKND